MDRPFLDHFWIFPSSKFEFRTWKLNVGSQWLILDQFLCWFMVLYWRNMYIVKKVSRGTCWDKQMPDCRKLKDWWLKAKVWSFLYDIGCLENVLAVKLPKRHWEDAGIDVETDKFFERLSGTEKEFLLGFDRSNSISYGHCILNYSPYAHSYDMLPYNKSYIRTHKGISRLNVAKFHPILPRYTGRRRKMTGRVGRTFGFGTT